MNGDILLDGKGNLKDTYISCLEEHKVIVDNQTFYLIKTFYGTNTRADFLKTFSSQIDDDLLQKIAVIPNDISYNEYAIVYDLSLKVVAVFNMKFAFYNFEKQKIIFREPEDILLTYYKENAKKTNKSVEQQLEEKLISCQEKVDAKIISLNEQKSANPPAPPGPPINISPPGPPINISPPGPPINISPPRPPGPPINISPPGPPGPQRVQNIRPIPVLDPLSSELEKKLKKINPDYKSKRKKRRDGPNWMDHALMYAAAPPIKK